MHEEMPPRKGHTGKMPLMGCLFATLLVLGTSTPVSAIAEPEKELRIKYPTCSHIQEVVDNIQFMKQCLEINPCLELECYGLEYPCLEPPCFVDCGYEGCESPCVPLPCRDECESENCTPGASDFCDEKCSEQLDTCGTALPVTPPIFGNGNSHFQLFQHPPFTNKFGHVYASWRLSTNNINNGADEFAFGYQFTAAEDGLLWNTGVEDSLFGHCVDLGFAPFNFEYQIDAGAFGWSTESSCTVTVSWKTSVGIKISVEDSGASTTITLGESKSCSDGSMFDSETLLRGSGQADCVSPVCVV